MLDTDDFGRGVVDTENSGYGALWLVGSRRVSGEHRARRTLEEERGDRRVPTHRDIRCSLLP